MLELLIFGIFMWAVIELIRRSALLYWQERKRRQFGGTIPQYQAWKKDLRERNG